jgi:hypothetical protein
MFLMPAAAAQTSPHANHATEAAVAAAVARVRLMVLEMTARQLDELARMRGIGMNYARQLERAAFGRLRAEEEAIFARKSRGIVNEFLGVARAVRQIVVLEQELAGLRPARRGPRVARAVASAAKRSRTGGGGLGPLRDDLGEIYDTRPVGEAVRWVRRTLGIAAPVGDPFAAVVAEAAGSDEVAESEAPPSDIPHRGAGTGGRGARMGQPFTKAFRDDGESSADGVRADATGPLSTGDYAPAPPSSARGPP